MVQYFVWRKPRRMKQFLELIIAAILWATLVGVDGQRGGDGPAKEGTVGNSRVAKVIEMHAHNIRQYFCKRRGGITAEQWDKIKTDCIGPRIGELIPENTVNAWDQCSQVVADLCDDQQWTDGKACARDVLANENIRDMQVWYRGKIRQVHNSVHQIRACAKEQKQKS